MSSLLDIIKPTPAIAGGQGRVHRLSNRPAARVHRIAAPGEDEDVPPHSTSVYREGVVAPSDSPHVPNEPAGEGETMPRGHYDRSKAKKRAKRGECGADAAPGAAAPAAGKKKVGRKRKARAGAAPVNAARTPRQGDARFAVYTDGSVLVDAPECKGTLSGEAAALLVEFIGRLKAK